jgi:2-iminobutanoate/2-iminopropanoate deaminase
VSKKVISTAKAPKAIGPYSQAIQIRDMLFVSGQLPLDPETGKLVAGDIKQQAKRVLENVEAILDEEGYTLNDVVKTTLFLRDISNFKAVNEAYALYFAEKPPARSAFQVAALPLNAELELELIAVK